MVCLRYLTECCLQEDLDKAQTLYTGFIVISTKEAKDYSQSVTLNDLSVELETEQLEEADAEVSELVSIHAKVDDRVHQRLRKNNAQDVSQLLDRIVFQQ